MELFPLRVILEVDAEKSFSRAAERLLRTQPAVSLAVQRLEAELGERLIDRGGRQVQFTDAGQVVVDYARRFENLKAEMLNALAELRDKAVGRVIVGANESATHYLLPLIERYRRLYPKVRIHVRGVRSSTIPSRLHEGDLELGIVSYEPLDERLRSLVIGTDRLAFIVSPAHPLARQRVVSIARLGLESFVAHNAASPFRNAVIREFERHKVPLHIHLEMPSVETIRSLVMQNEGVAFLPRVCVTQEIAEGRLREVRVRELKMERDIRLVYSTARTHSHAAAAFVAAASRHR